MFHATSLLAIALALPIGISAAEASAQPSGGPYGPIEQTYEIPSDAPHVFYVSPTGSPNATGAVLEAPTTLKAAIVEAVTGDVVVLRGGTYRTGLLEFNQGITLQPYQVERPVLKGTHVAKDWERLRGHLWRTKWDAFFPDKPQPWWERKREVMRTPLYRFNNDMVFVDGRMLQMVGWAGEVDENTFWIDYDEGYVYIGVDPAGKLVEITAYNCALVRTTDRVHGKESDKIGPKIRGITFTQYAFRAIEMGGTDPEGVAQESDYGKEVVGSIFENCTFSYCSRVAGYFRGDKMTIRHCLVSDTSTEGIFVLSSNDVLLERNVITRNNMEAITGCYASAVKIFNQCHRVTCRDNLVIDNKDSSGIWYDVGNADGVFINNWIIRTDNGFFFEISRRALCAGNVFVDCNNGIHILNSREVQVVQNTFVNSAAAFGRTERSAVGDHFGWHPATGPDVDERNSHVFAGNLLVADEHFRDPLLTFDQSLVLRDRLHGPQVSKLDDNVYVRRGDTVGNLISWSPTKIDNNWQHFDSPSELHQAYPQFAARSQYFSAYRGPLFQGAELSRYDLLPNCPGLGISAKLSERTSRLLGWPVDRAPVPGAFPLARQ